MNKRGRKKKYNEKCVLVGIMVPIRIKKICVEACNTAVVNTIKTNPSFVEINPNQIKLFHT